MVGGSGRCRDLGVLVIEGPSRKETFLPQAPLRAPPPPCRCCKHYVALHWMETVSSEPSQRNLVSSALGLEILQKWLSSWKNDLRKLIGKKKIRVQNRTYVMILFCSKFIYLPNTWRVTMAMNRKNSELYYKLWTVIIDRWWDCKLVLLYSLHLFVTFEFVQWEYIFFSFLFFQKSYSIAPWQWVLDSMH